jgi:hypothetical protein
MTAFQFLGLAAFVYWGSWLIGDAHGARITFGRNPADDIGPQRRTVSPCKAWQFCDEWRTAGPDGRMIERRVI